MDMSHSEFIIKNYKVHDGTLSQHNFPRLEVVFKQLYKFLRKRHHFSSSYGLLFCHMALEEWVTPYVYSYNAHDTSKHIVMPDVERFQNIVNKMLQDWKNNCVISLSDFIKIEEKEY